MTWYNPTEGTWVVSGEFATSSILAGSGVWIEDAKGSGNLLITYTPSGAKVFSSGVLQFSTMMAPAGIVTLSNKGTLGSVRYHPRAFTDAEAIALATGNITVSFTLRNLLNNSPQGVWYDPSDTTTLFQDSAGTTPVTASGQPVGRMLDKSGRGNHATQPTADRRPIYRRGDSRGVVNLLTWSEAFDNAAWTKGASTVTGGHAAPSGDLSAWKLIPDTSNAQHTLQRNLTHVVAEQVLTIYAKAAGYNVLQINWGSGAVAGDPRANFDLSNGTLGAVGAGLTASITAAGNGYYRCSVRFTAVAGTRATTYAVVPSTASSRGATLVGDGVSGLYLADAQLNLGPTALPYQRNDSHLGGVATGASTDLHWLETDGVDDGMATGNIDFTGTDKVSVFAGVRKLSDAAAGVLVELSALYAANNGTFGLFAPGAASPRYDFASRGVGGTTGGAFSSAFAAPRSDVLAGIGGISTDTMLLRVSGSQVASATADQGTGNYGNYPLYLFRRGGTSLPFNGWFYGLAITGRLTTDAETVATERFLAAKSAVVIP